MSASDAHDDGDTIDIAPTTTQDTTGQRSHRLHGLEMVDAGARRKVAKALNKFVDRVGTPAPDRFDDTHFQRGKAADFPEIPGEENKNPKLRRIRERFNQERDSDGNVTPSLRPQPSIAGSFTESVASRHSSEGLSRQLQRSLSPPSQAEPRRLRVNTLPSRRPSFELQGSSSPLSTGASGERSPRRRDTLDIASPVFRSLRSERSAHTGANDSVAGGLGSPAIVVTSSPEISPQDARASLTEAPSSSKDLPSTSP